MELICRLLADVVVVVHFGYVAFVLFGLLAVMLGWVLKWQWVRNPWFRCLHLTMILIVVLEAWFGITCPLTDWEHNLRKLAGQATHEGAFIADFVHELMFFEAEPWVFTACYTLFGTAVLASLFLVPPRWRSVAQQTSTAPAK